MHFGQLRKVMRSKYWKDYKLLTVTAFSVENVYRLQGLRALSSKYVRLLSFSITRLLGCTTFGNSMVIYVYNKTS